MNFIEGTVENISERIRGNSLKARAARGSLILGIGTFAERGMRLVRNMILARLLSRDDFGLMAIVLSVLVVLESFTDVGVRQSIIHHKEGGTREYLNVAWWIQAGRGIGLFAVAYFIAPAICRFYEKPELLNILRVAFAVVILNGLISPRLYLLDKEFRFAKSLFLVQGSALLGTAVVIVLALYMRSVWVLVIGHLAQIAIQCLFSHILCPFRPRLRIDSRCLKEFLKFGRGMVGLSFLTVLAMRTDIFVMAKMISSEDLGMYALALSLAQQPVFLFSRTVGRTLLPAFAERQHDKAALCLAVAKILRSILLLGVPLVVIVCLWGGGVLSVVYGPTFAAVATPFALMCISTLFYTQAVVLSKIYMGIGKPHLHRRYVILLSGLIMGLMYPGVKYLGLTGAAGVLAFSHAAAVLAQVVWMKKTIGLEFRDYIGCWWPLSRASVAGSRIK